MNSVSQCVQMCPQTYSIGTGYKTSFHLDLSENCRRTIYEPTYSEDRKSVV